MNRLHFNFLLPLILVFISCANNAGPEKDPLADKTTDTTLAAKNNAAPGTYNLTKPTHKTGFILPTYIFEHRHFETYYSREQLQFIRPKQDCHSIIDIYVQPFITKYIAGCCGFVHLIIGSSTKSK